MKINFSNEKQNLIAYKIINRQCPESLWDKYHHKTQHSNYRTRNCKDLQILENLQYVNKSLHFSDLNSKIFTHFSDLNSMGFFRATIYVGGAFHPLDKSANKQLILRAEVNLT